MSSSTNPFLLYRHRLDSYATALAGGLDDGWFVETVSKLDAEVAVIEGHGFTVTPLVEAADLARAIGVANTLVVKDETGSVAGSHKSRHLFGVALGLLVEEALAAAVGADQRLAIASCGNAALAAAVVAAALKRPLDVYVPTWADDGVVQRLQSLGASVRHCPRRNGESGDPAFLRFQEALQNRARAFSVQATVTPSTLDGARTLGWELVDQAASRQLQVSEAYVQVGGGALATSLAMALPSAVLYPVQTEGCAPLRRAWDRLDPEFDFDHAARHPDHYMWPWTPEPTSAATGILDDVTHDWLPLLRHTRTSGGEPVVASEDDVVKANRLARTHTDIPVSVTGSAGLAGLLSRPPSTDGVVALLFTGIGRGEREVAQPVTAPKTSR